MASTSSLLPTGVFDTLDTDPCKYKKRKTDCTANVERSVLPTLCNSAYYTEPSIDEIAAREAADAGYCGRVPNFVVGRAGYGRVRFLGITDVRRLELDHIVTFDRSSVSVYGDETESPPAGEGLNKPAEVTLFPVEEDEESEGLRYLPDQSYRGKEHMRTDSPRSSAHRHLQGSPQKVISKMTPPSIRKTPQALIEYNVNSSDLALSRHVLMTGQNKGLIPRPKKVGGFKFDPKYETPVTGEYSKNVVDAALFMGRSFRVGWGPNGVLVHTGSSVGSLGSGLSSVITMEKIAVDKATRDDKNNVKEDVVDMYFSSPLDQHKELDRESVEVDVSGFKLELHN